MSNSSLRDQCSALVLNLNNRLSENRHGSLIQVWLPEINSHARTVLSTQGLPYAVAGVGDLLALFRCISCRFSFGTDVMQPRLLGAVGRVYTTSEPEICADVQRYDKKIYLRVSEAQRCRVHSTVVVPFFEPSVRHRALGVIEVVRNDRGTSFNHLLENVIASLEAVSLCTSDINLNQIEEGLKQWPADSDLHFFDFGFDFLTTGEEPMTSLPGVNNDNNLINEKETNTHDQHRNHLSSLVGYCCNDAPDVMDAPHGFLGADAVGIPASSLYPSSQSQINANYLPFPSFPFHGGGSSTEQQELSAPVASPFFNLGEKDIPGLIGMAQMNAGSMFQALPPSAVGPGNLGDGVSLPVEDNSQVLDKGKLEELLHVLTGNKHRKKRRGKMGSGKHLTYKDLQQHFKLGLKDAAAKLGICPTTLKRACRRNGIKRWPSRHVVKTGSDESTNQDNNQQLDEDLNVDKCPSDYQSEVNQISTQQPQATGRLVETLRSIKQEEKDLTSGHSRVQS